MQKIVINKADDLCTLAEDMRKIEDLELVFAGSSEIPFLRNVISFKFLERQADLLGKKISFVNEKGESLKFLEAESYQPSLEEKEFSKDAPVQKMEIFSILKNAALLAGVFLLLIGLGIGFWWVVPKADVVININSEMLVKNVDITASAKAEKVSESNKEIPAVLLEAVRKLSDSIQTSGEKEVGEKAKGTVKIYNKTSGKKTFSKGTKLILITADTEELNYYTLEDVVVEERQELPKGITYGFSEVGVEAENFGAVYNIKEDQKFYVDDHKTSDFLAQNEKEFLGGSSKKVHAVSEKDKEALKQTLEEKLKLSAKTDLELKLVGEQKIAENSIGFEIFDEVFDKNVDDEADKLNLSLQGRTYTLAYYQNDLEQIVKSVLERSVPEQYAFSDAETRFEIGNVLASKPMPLSKDKLELLVKVRSFVVPKISAEEVRDNIANVRVPAAKEYLDSLKNVTSYELTVWPRLPGFLNTTPHIKSRIKVEIRNE